MGVRLNPYIILDGNAKEAIAFYQKALEAEVVGVQTFGEMPSDPNYVMPEEMKDRIMHGNLKVGDSELMFSDTMPGSPYQTGNHLTIAIVINDPEQSKRIFAALSEGGRVVMPIQQTTWSPAYGQVADRYGVEWQVNTVPTE